MNIKPGQILDWLKEVTRDSLDETFFTLEDFTPTQAKRVILLTNGSDIEMDILKILKDIDIDEQEAEEAAASEPQFIKEGRKKKLNPKWTGGTRWTRQTEKRERGSVTSFKAAKGLIKARENEDRHGGRQQLERVSRFLRPKSAVVATIPDNQETTTTRRRR